MRTTSKPVIEKLQYHILNKFGADYGWDNSDAVANLKQQIASMRYGDRSDYQAAKDLVEGGTFLAYHFDVNNFMNDLDINDKQKDYTDEQTWELYTHLLSREICKLVN